MNTALLAVGITTGVFSGLSLLLLVAETYLADYGTCKLDVNGGAAVFEVRGGGTLLQVLYESKIFIPSACGGKGSCGYCKATVGEGGGPVLPTELPYLNRSEVRSGVRLACQVKVKKDTSIKIPEEILFVKEFKAKVVNPKALTYDIRELNFELIEPAEIKQRPGQYVQILAPGPDGEVFRAYSISSPAYDKHKVQLMVRLIPGGIASTYLHKVQDGDPITFTGPYGEFHLSEDPNVEIICVGGGAGMAPMANIIFTLYSRWPDRTCYLFFGCRGTRDVFYLDEYKELAKKHPNFHVIYSLSDPLKDGETWDGDTGFIHLSCDKRLEKGVPRQAFLCGPPPMIDAVTVVLKEKGIAEEDIFYDKF